MFVDPSVPKGIPAEIITSSPVRAKPSCLANLSAKEGALINSLREPVTTDVTPQTRAILLATCSLDVKLRIGMSNHSLEARKAVFPETENVIMQSGCSKTFTI